MKKVTFTLISCLLVQLGSLYAACHSEACNRAVAWKNGYTAIVLDDGITRNDYFAVLDVVKANKGVVAIEAERVLLGWLPAKAAGTIRTVPGVRAVLYEAVPLTADLVHREDAIAALSFFNRVRTGEYEDEVEAGLVSTARPLTGCVIDKPMPGATQVQSVPNVSGPFATDEKNPATMKEGTGTDRLDPAGTWERRGGVTPNFWFHTPYQNPDMRGRVTVQLFRLDSDGTTDPDLYTWTSADFLLARDQVYSAFTFWVDQATARNITLSFRVEIEDPFSRFRRSVVPTPTHYEPIMHSSADDYLWVNDALTRFGYGASPLTNQNVYAQNEAYNRAKAADPVYGPFDRSFSVYVVYNPGSAPGTFTNGQRAYTMFDGPFEMVMWNSGGWGPNNLGLVITHETGHIFWACDEYYDAPSNTGCFSCDHCFYNVGPRNQQATPWIRNANCDNPAAASCDMPRVSCVMRDSTHTLCPNTPAQIGW